MNNNDFEGPKRLRRSEQNRIFLGVCGGIAEYLNLDPALIRIIWIFLFFAYGLGIFAYLLVAFIMSYTENN